jgi:hypothetical protein
MTRLAGIAANARHRVKMPGSESPAVGQTAHIKDAHDRDANQEVYGNFERYTSRQRPFEPIRRQGQGSPPFPHSTSKAVTFVG